MEFPKVENHHVNFDEHAIVAPSSIAEYIQAIFIDEIKSVSLLI